MISEVLSPGSESFPLPSYHNSNRARSERLTNPAQRHWLGRLAMRAVASLSRGHERVVTHTDRLVDAQTASLALADDRLKDTRNAFAPLNRRYDRGVMSTLHPDQLPSDYAAAREAYEAARTDVVLVTDQNAALAGMSGRERGRMQEEFDAQEALSLQAARPEEPERMPARAPGPVPPLQEPRLYLDRF